MDITSIGNTRVTAPPQPSAPDSSGDGLPGLAAFQRVAWFDLNGDGKIDNVPTLYGGDAYMDPSADSIDEQLADRVAISAPSHHLHSARHVTPERLARAQAAYAEHAAERVTEHAAAR
jgi:hypothetical protein